MPSHLLSLARAASLAAPLALAGLPLPALADVDGPGGYGPGMMWRYGHGPGLLGPVMMVLIVAILVAVVVLVVRHFTGHQHPHHGTKALEILKERFARGEIDAEDYKVRRQMLNE